MTGWNYFDSATAIRPRNDGFICFFGLPRKFYEFSRNDGFVFLDCFARLQGLCNDEFAGS